MGWMVFEIAINFVQAFLVYFYVKKCFLYDKQHPAADIILITSFASYFSIYLFYPAFPLSQQLAFIFPLIYTLAFSAEPKASVLYWLLILTIIFNLISVLMCPVFDLIPALFHFTFPSYWLERALCIISTNISVFLMLKLIIRLKKPCTFPRNSAYTIFIFTVSVIYTVEESVYDLYTNVGDYFIFSFLKIYLGLLACIIFLIFLFYAISNDSERENRYQAEISLLTLSKQHQRELSQMYEDLTERQHDYKQHLQTLRELVSNDKDSTAEKYLNSVISDNLSDEMIVTGSPEIDALLTAKRRIMRERGIEFIYVPYPLASLPIHVSDFCSIVGNLLDNAIEGVDRIKPTPTSPSIRLAFSRSWDMFYIYCENPCDTSTIIKEKDHFVSSKQKTEPGMHGIGMHSINAIADRDEGRVEFYIESNTFYAKVVLPYLNERGKYQ